MNVWHLAWRNLLRNRRRTTTTVLAMVIGLMSILLFGGYTRSIRDGLLTDTVRQGGHLQIQHRDYFRIGSGDPIAYGIAGSQTIIDLLARDPALSAWVAVITPVLTVHGIAGNFAAGASRTVAGAGVVVSDQNRMRAWNGESARTSRSAELALTGTAPNAVVIGIGLARVLRLCDALHIPDCPHDTPLVPTDGAAMPDGLARLSALESSPERPASTRSPRIQLLASMARGAPNVADLSVVKAQRQGVKEIDDMFVQMHLAQAQRLVYGPDADAKVTAIEVQLKHTRDVARARARIEAVLRAHPGAKDLAVLDFETLNPQYSQVIGMFGAIFGFMALLMATIVMFMVGNTMRMAIMERLREIGTLRAIGVRASGIRRMFLCEGAVLGLGGALAGTVLALCIARMINAADLHWLPPGQSEPVALSIRLWDAYGLCARCAIGMVALTTVSAWLPARSAARRPISAALREA